MSHDKVKLITGSYIQVADTLGFSNKIYASMEKKEYLSTISRDLPRMRSFYSKKDRVALLADLMSSSDGIDSYNQGDFDGGFFTYYGRYRSRLIMPNLTFWVENYKDLTSDFDFAYINDEGIPCAFSIKYLYDPALKKYFFNLAVIENVTAPPALKRVTYISHPTILPQEIAKDVDRLPDIDVDAIPALLRKRLKSKTVFQIVRNLTTQYPSAFLCCRELDMCFVKPDNIGFYVDLPKMKRIKALFDTGFSTNLLELKEKVMDLRLRLFDSAADEVDSLVAVLEGNRNTYVKGKIKLNEFVRNCEDVIKAAREGELQIHRSIWGVILNNLIAALNVLTRGNLAARPTDSMFKINKMDESITSLSSRLSPIL